jgi:hypothetical protein
MDMYLGMDSPIDILKAVEIDANNKQSLGRGFTCGVSNMGVVSFDSNDNDHIKHSHQHQHDHGHNQPPPSPNSHPCDHDNNNNNDNKKNKAIVSIESGYYGTSHSRNGVLCQLSTMTINDQLYGCIQFTHPLVTDDVADYFISKLQYLLQNL